MSSRDSDKFASAGYSVDAASIAKAQTYLHDSLTNHANMRPDLQAYVVYALALNSDAHTDEIESAWNKRNSMTTQGLAMLGLTQNAKGDHARAKEIADKLESTATTTDSEASWTANYDYFMEFEIDDAAETTAYAVRLLSFGKAGKRCASKSRILAGESSQRRIFLGQHKTNRDGNFRPHRIYESKPRTRRQFPRRSFRKWKTSVGAPIHFRGFI